MTLIGLYVKGLRCIQVIVLYRRESLLVARRPKRSKSPRSENRLGKQNEKIVINRK
jgi:hypothetical protein